MGNRTGGSSAKGFVNEMNWAYKQMLDIQKKANSLSLRMNSLDTSKNVNELRELSLQFARLKSDYQTLKTTFGSQLTPIQLGNLQAELDDTTAKLSAMDAKISDTICLATFTRQEEASRLASECDAMVVIGGKHSANSVHLAKICSEHCSNVQFIERTEGLNLDMLKTCNIVQKNMLGYVQFYEWAMPLPPQK